MRNFLLSICLLIGTTALFSQQDSLGFPGNWEGEWTGDLVISTSAGEVQRLPMILRILPQEDSRYTFTIVYGEDTPENTRPYFLETIDAEKGHYVTDEENSILLDDYLINGKLYSRFEVMGNLLLSTLEERGGQLIYEIISGPLAPTRTTGDTIIEGEEVPPVNSYYVKVQQRAVLVRKESGK
ncbi:hypothetical protein [Lewinella cohaerens]|uniref:hypothetical protein n=1 Tax=Lewinella cohaerens TaxID=70995 RepID=UPI00037A4BCA|nr:hypothetical protein [Lewinella cohaerens]